MAIFVKICLSLTFVCAGLLVAMLVLGIGVESTKETPKGIVKWLYERMMEICLFLGAGAAWSLIMCLIGMIWR